MDTESVYTKHRGVSTLLLSLLFSITAPLFGGIAFAATAPTVTALEFKDTNGTPDTSDDTVITMATGYKAYRIAIDSKGSAYVSDPEVNRVYKFNSNGHLAKVFGVGSLPLGVAVNDGGDIYVSGYINGFFTIYVLDQNGVVKGVLGRGEYADIAIDEQGSLITIDRGGSVVKVLDRNGVLQKTFGGYLERFDGPEAIGSYSYARTRHSFGSASGVAVDRVAGEIYVTFREYVEYLSNVACTGTNPNCVQDPDSYSYYANTDATYKYWYPAGARYLVMVIDENSGTVKRRIELNTYLQDGTTTLNPRGLALDDMGRLYVGTYTGIMVFDSSTGAALTVNGSFGAGCFKDIAYDAATKRLFATGENVVSVYGIDGGSNPGNTPPSAPALLSPVKAYVNSLTPTLRIANATDTESDPLLYGYELRDGNGARITSASLTPEGPNGETSMAVNAGLTENTLYLWRAQSFDGNASAWSEENAFCVNERNDNPQMPTVVSPTDNAPASPFSTLLTWTPSTDPDCYDTVTYNVEVSAERSFGFVLSSSVTGTSLKLGDLARDLTNGGTYYWRVKAVDNNGGESAYSEGSFVYRTTMVSFTSDQADTQVYIDGNYGYLGRLLGTVPKEVQNITPGSHFVTFIKAGYEPFYETINVVDDGSILPVSATMIASSKIRPSAAGTELARLDSGGSSPFVVDYNNDGLKDIIAGGMDGRVYLYLSEKQVHDGAEKVVLSFAGMLQADGADINVSSRAVPFVVDFNNDSRKDLLVGSGDGLVKLYLNTGDEVAPVFTLAGTIKDGAGNDIKSVSNSAPVAIDYNSDGKKDLVLGSADGTLRLYLNSGSTDSSPIFNQSYETINADDSVLNIGSNSKPFFTDWNSDGKTDLLVGSGSILRLYLNVGSNGSPSFAYSSDIRDLTGGSGEVSPFVVDWEGTSARDIVAGNGLGSIVLYVSACGGGATGNIPPVAPVLLAPLNGDDVASVMPDLFVANSTDTEGCPLTYGYEVKDGSGAVVASDSGIAESSDGKTSMKVNQALTENTVYYWRAQAFDGDTVTGPTWSDWNGSFCVNERNDNPVTPVISSPVDNAAASIFSTSLAWNISTDPDCRDTVSYHMEVSGDQSFGSPLASRSLAGVSIRLEDLGISMVNNGVYYWRVKAVDSNGGESAYSAGSFTYKTTAVRFESDQQGAKVYIDGNYGYLGRLLGSAPLYVEGLTPGSHFVSFVKAGYETVYKIINVADPMVNGSALTVSARGEEWSVASKISTNTLGKELFKTSGNSAPFVVDYNNDGLKDVIAGDADGNIYLYLSEEQLQSDGSTKDVLVARGALRNINVGSRAVPFVVDYNNDGRKDLLVGSSDGQVYVYLNTGTDEAPEFTSATTVKDGSGSDIRVLSNSAPVIVDYNNDGRKDLVVGGTEGTLRLYLNAGADDSPVYPSIYANIKVDGADLRDGTDSKAFFTDWNSDGKKDLLVGAETGTVHLYLNVGSDGSPDFRSITALQQWIRDRMRERGNTEYMAYSGYTQDIGDLTGGAGEASPFVVKWGNSTARDLILGNGTGGVVVYNPQAIQQDSGTSGTQGRLR